MWPWRRKRLSCPSCGKDNLLPIVYGLPGQELLKTSARREVLLGGCIIDSNSPEWQCVECGHAWGARDKRDK